MKGLLKLLEWFKNQRVFQRFFISYIAATLIPIVILSTAVFSLYANYHEELTSHNDAILNQVRDMTNQKLGSINKIIQELSINTSLAPALNIIDSSTPESIETLARVVSSLSLLKSVHDDSIEDMYLYLAGSQTIVTPSGKLSSRYFYGSTYDYGIPFDTWFDEILSSRKSFDCRSYTVTSDYAPQTESIVISTSLPVGETRQPKGRLVMHVRKDYLYNIIGSSSQTLAVLDQDNTPMFSNNPLSPETVSGILDGDQVVRIMGRKNGYSMQNSELWGWKYVIFQPEEIYTGKIRTMVLLIVLSTVLVLVSGLLLAYYLARRSYRPINELASIFPDGKTAENEYDFLKSNISEVIYHREALESEMERHRPVIRQNLYRKLLKGGISRQDADAVRELGFSHPFYTVMLVEPEPSGSTPASFAYLSTFTDAVRGLLGDSQRLTTMENNMLCILSGHETNGGDLELLIAQIRLAADKWQLIPTFSIGRPSAGLKGIHKSFTSAAEAMKYKLIKGAGSILTAQDIAPDEADSYYYPLEMEAALINCIKTVNIDQAISLLSSILHENFEVRSLSYPLAQCLVYDIISTVNKILWELEINSLEVFGEDPIGKLTGCQAVQSLHSYLLHIFDVLGEYLNRNKSSHNERLKRQIEQYIHDQFTNPDFSLTMVADELGINSSYLSRYFKEQFGQNFVEFVSRCRIEKAKDLLREESSRINTVAEQVGYANSAALTRIFKKYEGITPSQFKDGR